MVIGLEVISVSNETADPLAEVKAMQKVAEAVTALDAEATARVLRWAVAFYNVTTSGTSSKGRPGGVGSGGGSDTGNGNGQSEGQRFTDLAELYAATSPEGEADKALVVGYWFQFGQGQPDFGGQEINTALKNLGHPIKNITSAFNALKARKPAPVMQLKKAGTSQQARKTYKLTVAGKSAVELMIRQH
jgi:hypothetical protein